MEFGCKLSPYDLRDYKLKAGTATLPEEYVCDFKASVKNQWSVSSCVAHATSSILEHHAGGKYELSTNFIYGIQKKLYNHDGKGMYLRDACKIAVNYGDMLLDDCPGNTEVPKCYSIAEKAFQDSTKIDRAKVFRTLKFYSCGTPYDIKQAIYNHGPVLASIKWFDSFKVDRNGTLIGDISGSYTNHAFVIYGYTKDGFWCQNSWGPLWGKNGRFFLPNTVKIVEARGFIDVENQDEVDALGTLVEPKTNGFLDFFYKCFNAIINLFIKKS